MVAALRFVLNRAPGSIRQWQVTAGGASLPGCGVRPFIMALVWAAAVPGTEFTHGHISGRASPCLPHSLSLLGSPAQPSTWEYIHSPPPTVCGRPLPWHWCPFFP